MPSGNSRFPAASRGRMESPMMLAAIAASEFALFVEKFAVRRVMSAFPKSGRREFSLVITAGAANCKTARDTTILRYAR